MHVRMHKNITNLLANVNNVIGVVNLGKPFVSCLQQTNTHTHTHIHTHTYVGCMSECYALIHEWVGICVFTHAIKKRVVQSLMFSSH